MIFLRDSLCLSAVTLSRQWHDNLDFSNCPLSRVLHVTLANWQGFGFEFHLRSSPSAYSGWILHSLLHRAEETQQGRNSCPRLQFGFQFGLYRVVVPLSFHVVTALHHCLLVFIVRYFIFYYDGSWKRSLGLCLATGVPAGVWKFAVHSNKRKCMRSEAVHGRFKLKIHRKTPWHEYRLVAGS